MHDLNAMLRHEVHRRQVTEDLFGYVRLSIYLAQGVTFPATSPGPPKPGTPTFEKLMGREPVPFMPGLPRPALEEAEISEAAARAMAMVSVAGVKRTKGRGTTKRPAPEAPSG